MATRYNIAWQSRQGTPIGRLVGRQLRAACRAETNAKATRKAAKRTLSGSERTILGRTTISKAKLVHSNLHIGLRCSTTTPFESMVKGRTGCCAIWLIDAGAQNT